jgi:hypothetical protein
MDLTLENLDRRVTALEKAAETEKNIVRAVSEIVSESEERTRDRISAVERRFVELLNERFDAVMVAIDRRYNPPK